MFKSFIIVIAFFLALHASSQENPSYFVQFKISQVSSIEEAQVIDKKIGTKKGIVSTHTDYKTSTYFCTYSTEVDYTFEDFQSWLSKLGYEISCFNKGIQGSASLISPYELKGCIETSDN